MSDLWYDEQGDRQERRDQFVADAWAQLFRSVHLAFYGDDTPRLATHTDHQLTTPWDVAGCRDDGDDRPPV